MCRHGRGRTPRRPSRTAAVSAAVQDGLDAAEPKSLARGYSPPACPTVEVVAKTLTYDRLGGGALGECGIKAANPRLRPIPAIGVVRSPPKDQSAKANKDLH
jgi:hypothetical protein